MDLIMRLYLRELVFELCQGASPFRNALSRTCSREADCSDVVWRSIGFPSFRYWHVWLFTAPNCFSPKNDKLGIGSQAQEITGQGIVRNSAGSGGGTEKILLSNLGTDLATDFVPIRGPGDGFYLLVHKLLRVAEIWILHAQTFAGGRDLDCRYTCRVSTSYGNDIAEHRQFAAMKRIDP